MKVNRLHHSLIDIQQLMPKNWFSPGRGWRLSTCWGVLHIWGVWPDFLSMVDIRGLTLHENIVALVIFCFGLSIRGLRQICNRVNFISTTYFFMSKTRYYVRDISWVSLIFWFLGVCILSGWVKVELWDNWTFFQYHVISSWPCFLLWTLLH